MDNIKNISIIFIIIIFLITIELKAQMNLEGDFRVRYYSDQFYNTMDNHGAENYFRFMGRLRGKMKAGNNIFFNTEIISLSDNPFIAARNIQGTGKMKFGISQLYGDLLFPDFLVFDLARLRVGRQQFGIGNGLSFGDSYYYLDKFDGVRADFAYNQFSLTLFGAITGQNLSSSGLYPEPGSDEIYAAKLGANIEKHEVISYFILQRLRGLFNDNYIAGGGVNGSFLRDKLEYFGEFAYQKFNTLPGLPEKAGIGYMAGVSYIFPFSIFRSVKVEARFAAFQGDDATTEKIEQFSPAFPNLFWGDRTGYVNGEVGGDYPHKGLDLEGSRIFYGRIYFVPEFMPKIRLQFQYVLVRDYVNNDGVTTKDDEFGVRLYYSLTKQTQLQFRFARTIPNAEDLDLNKSGVITSIEDRYGVNRFMFEINMAF